MERNLRLLPVHAVLADTLPWLPILVLFTRGDFGIDGALQLASIFYLAVVVAEVPSGWMSDRLGRVVTIQVAAALWIVGHLLFVFSNSSFAMVAAGEVLLALGFATLSGTDVSLHYDTLEALELQAEYEARQSKLRSVGFLAVSASALVGGSIGLVDLRLPFVISLVFAVIQFGVASQFSEPPRAQHDEEPGFVEQLRSCRKYLDQPLLRWVLGYWIAMVVLEHVAYTMAQPYLTEVLGKSPDDLGATALVAGVQFALFSFFGALAASQASRLRERFGFFQVLLVSAVLSALIISTMALVVSVAVAIFMLFRSVQGAVAPTLLSAAVAPVVAQRHRATYLSLHSLAGRFTYGTLLYVMALAVGDDLGASLSVLAVASWILVVLVLGSLMLSGSMRRNEDLREEAS